MHLIFFLSVSGGEGIVLDSYFAEFAHKTNSIYCIILTIMCEVISSCHGIRSRALFLHFSVIYHDAGVCVCEVLS